MTPDTIAEFDLGALIAQIAHAPDHPDPISVSLIPTPLDPMIAAATSEGLCLLEFADRRACRAELGDLIRLLGRPVVEAGSMIAHPHLDAIRAQLAAYFAGEIRTFTVPLLTPGTPFERRVWAQLRTIPFGRTCSYADLAAAIGNPDASRAVGGANGRNRIAIVIPCHRVIESGGGLRGYGGGLERKRFLLDHERNASAPTLFD